MRRSQRLHNKYVETDKVLLCMDKKNSLPSEDRKRELENQNQEEESVENGSDKHENCLAQLPTGANESRSIVVTNNTQQKNFKKGKERKVSNNENDSISTQPQTEGRTTMRSSIPTAAKRGRKRLSILTRNNRKCKRNCLVTATNSGEIKPPIIPIDNYLNPLRNPLLQPGANIQNTDFSYYNPNFPRMNTIANNNSLLPQVYPTHFANQNYTVANGLNHPQQLPTVPAWDVNAQPEIHFPTPELSEPFDFDSSTSTLSLPESLREVFGCDDIRDVLKLDKVVYRMRLLHLQTLAFVLNIEYDYLHDLIEKIMKLDTETLKKVILAFQPDHI
ncbi:uncharacterized protein LOC101450483 [Ceratitis capitata]|uniref:uncharacterized protein LOC101450483 n=1 Tax=Ceratitis capitata TaxID=7213 RepID=UPI00061880F7|nr:uncharacterized protein LOC101450483 [Ceratitis capitata]